MSRLLFATARGARNTMSTLGRHMAKVSTLCSSQREKELMGVGMEPVAWINSGDLSFDRKQFGHLDVAALYSQSQLAAAEQQASKPLTDEQLDRVIEIHAGGADWSDDEYDGAVSFARAIEAAHGITGGPHGIRMEQRTQPRLRQTPRCVVRRQAWRKEGTASDVEQSCEAT